jgi:3-dehydroquinate synthetase
MTLDKKRAGSRTTWILPEGLGNVRVTSDVPDSVVDAAINLVIGHGMTPGSNDSRAND